LTDSEETSSEAAQLSIRKGSRGALFALGVAFEPATTFIAFRALKALERGTKEPEKPHANS
jgi:hypothetical protein